MADENDPSTVSIAITNVIATVICTPNDAPVATMIASTKTTPSRPWPHCDADHKGSPQRTVSPRTADAPEQPPDYRSALRLRIWVVPTSRENSVGVFECSISVDVPPPDATWCAPVAPRADQLGRREAHFQIAAITA
jgi:hypothetical protein